MRGVFCCLTCLVLAWTSLVNASIPGMRRRIRLGLFFSRSLTNRWITEKNRPITELTLHLKNSFLQKYNALWAEPKLGTGMDMKWELTNVQYLSAEEESNLRAERAGLVEKSGSYAGAKAFALWAENLNKQRPESTKWHIPVYLIDKKSQADFNDNTPGMAYGGACELNSVVIEGRVVWWRLEPLYANLLAHEVGHILGLPHPTREECLDDIMWAPGSNSNFSTCTQKKAREIFSDPWVYPCLPYQSGTMPDKPIDPNRVSDDDLAVIKQNCPDGVVETHENVKVRYYYAGSYLAWFKKAKKWWHKDNVCKWLPCRLKHNGHPLFIAITPLIGRRCGVNKICESESDCVSAGDSGCAETRELVGTSGGFTSYKYDGQRTYYPNMKCSWRITVPQGQRIRLRFDAMDIPGFTQYCGKVDWAGDSVIVYDGRDAKASALAYLCNGNKKTVESTSNVLYVTFTSDYNQSTVGAGFSASYVTV